MILFNHRGIFYESGRHEGSVIKNRAQQSIERYLLEISQVPLLSQEWEIELARRIKKNDRDALEKLTKANLRFVVSVAKQYQNRGLTLGDLINEGNIGLMKAAERFDETRGFKFISYAVWWIRQSIIQALGEQSRIVRLPLNRVGALKKINKASHTLEQEFERQPSAEEIAEELEITTCDVLDTLNISGKQLSLDAPFSQKEDKTLLDVMRDDRQSSPDNLLLNESLRVEVNRALATLTAREAKIIKLYFGLEGERPQNLEEIGERFHLTRERVRQIKEKALQRLRYHSRSRRLQRYTC